MKRLILICTAFLLAACEPLPGTLPPPTATPDPRCQYGAQSEFYSTLRTLRYDHGEHLETLLPISTPEAQGMDGAILQAALPRAEAHEEVLSLIVVRHGSIVLEEYFHSGRRDLAWNIHSVSKSFISALTGIAIEQGLLRSNTTASEVLPEYFTDLSEDDPRRTITVSDLLSMTAGFDWTEMQTSFTTDDWVNDTIHMGLRSVPGARFNYNTPSTHLLSAMLARVSGMSTCDFGYLNLFDPLGITVDFWPTDPTGVHVGGNSMYMTAREMAVFGQLFLQEGRWNGQQLIPADWVATSTQRKRVSYYGFFWWVDQFGDYPVFEAIGYGGQWIVVIPDLDMVVVSTAETRIYVDGLNSDDMWSLLNNYVIPAVID